MRYYLVAGEASGDLHASNLIRGLRAEDPQAAFRFRGGEKMLEAAQDPAALTQHYREGAVMGVTDVLRRAGKLIRSLRECERDILAWRPDAVILVDYPGFNLRLAKSLHSKGLKVFYYIAPKTWASRPGRNSLLRKCLDGLFIVFPFEKEYFDRAGVPYVYRGNPLLDAVDAHRYDRVCVEPYIALLPGSRKGEISRMMPVCMEAARRLGRKVVIAGAPGRSLSDYERFIRPDDDALVLFDRTYDILKWAGAAVINSGTASLEAALIGTPQVVGWSTSPMTFFVAKRILRVGSRIRFISLGNLILGREAFRELIQGDLTADALVPEVTSLLEDGSRRDRMIADYADIRSALGGSGASRAVAAAMIERMSNNSI